jgi:hypothetical protein
MGKLRDILNALTGHDPRRNADGTMTTKHGNRIIPYQVTVTPDGGLHANVVRFRFQPRVRELMQQMAPLLEASYGETLLLHPETGDFYLRGDVERNGIGKATALGQIDMDLEESLFRAAAETTAMKKMFGDARHDNPIVLDERTGRVYAENRPEETRGHVSLGPTVHNAPAPPAKRGLFDFLFR